MLARNIRYQQDLVDQRCNSARRDWRALSLLLAHYDGCGAPEITIPKITHETLAEMVGTTRSRICHFRTGSGIGLRLLREQRQAERHKIKLLVLPAIEAIELLKRNPKDTNAILHVTC